MRLRIEQSQASASAELQQWRAAAAKDRPRKRLMGALKHGGEVGLHALHPRGMAEERRLSLLRLVTQHLGARTQSPLLEEG